MILVWVDVFLSPFFTLDDCLGLIIKNVNISEHKKDPGVPNLFPFKEEILKQAEDKKRRVSA